ncbi:MAG TPA: hypothetical protein VFG68_02070 [Fimbriiglobus sp.]|nr:hypothetical protein [Fimbriiglobus sp.]
MRPLSVLLLSAGLFALGCSSQPPPPAVATAKSGGDDHGHEHTKDKMKEAHAGKYHAWLTAHLSKTDGNELDVFFEGGSDEDLKPAPIPVAKFTATAKRVSDDKEFQLMFEPAPMDEREGDPPGACSHFVAKAPWLTADDVLTVSAQVELDGTPRKPTWRTFEVKKYTHHAD